MAMPNPNASTQGTRILDEERDYQRIFPDNKARMELRERGFTWVLSSNVSAVRATQGNLYIRFHNGSVYEYPRMGGRYEDIINAESKGRWVWNELRRKNVPYSKIGAMPMDGDIDVSDDAIMDVGISVQEIIRLPRNVIETVSKTARSQKVRDLYKKALKEQAKVKEQKIKTFDDSMIISTSDDTGRRLRPIDGIAIASLATLATTRTQEIKRLESSTIPLLR